MLPLALLKAAQANPVLVELKSGETYNGHLVQIDTWMNTHLREVICTSKDGDRFWRMAEIYLRGSSVKYFRIPEEVMEKAREENIRRDDRRPAMGGRGRGRTGRGMGPGRGESGRGRGSSGRQ